MKKLIRLMLMVGLVAGLGYGWFRQSVHYALLELGKAFREGDVAVIERHLDLEAFVRAGGRFGAALARAEGRRLGGDLVGALVGGLAETIGDRVDEVVGPRAVQELKRALARKEGIRNLGPFQLAEGYHVIHDVTMKEDGAQVTLAGTCKGAPARLAIRMVRVPGPLGLPWLGTWRASDVDDYSLTGLAESCRDGGRSARGG